MLKNANDLKEKISGKLLIGAITLEAFLGNSPLVSAQGTGEKALSSNYILGGAGLVLGAMLCMGGDILNKDGHEKVGKGLKYMGFFVLGATAGYAF
ncbi:MAG: hypothetical protein ABIE36_01575 [Candidatus Diapherotrites archaeon]